MPIVQISIFGRAGRVLAAVALLTFSLSTTLAQPRDPVALAPPETILFVGVPDYDEFVEAYQKTSDYRMMQDPAIRTMEAEDKKLNLNKVRERLATALGLPPDDVTPPLKGPLAFYLSGPRGGTMEQLEGTLILGIGDAARARKIYDALSRKFRERSESYESVSIGSHSVDVYSRQANPEDEEDEDFEEDEDIGSWLFYSPEENFSEMVNELVDGLIEGKNFPEKLALCLTEDRFIAGSSADAVRTALRQPQSGESLADHEDYKTFLRRFPDAGSARFVVDIPRVVELFTGEDDEAKKFASSLGLDGVRSLVLSLHMGAREYDAKSEAILFMRGDRSGIPSLLSMENRPVTPPAALASRPIFAMWFHINPVKVVDEIERMVRKVSPEQADEMRRNLENAPGPDGETLNLRKDLIENLREPLTFSFGFARPYTPDSLRILFSIAHRKADTIIKLLESSLPAAPRDMREATVFDFPPFGVSLAISPDRFYSGITAAVESALQASEGQELAADADFKRAAKLLPEEAWGVFYFNPGHLLDAMIAYGEKRDELKEMASMSAGPMIAQSFAEMYSTRFKTAKPDDVRPLLKYYGPMVFTLTTTPDGLRISQIVLRPESE